MSAVCVQVCVCSDPLSTEGDTSEAEFWVCESCPKRVQKDHFVLNNADAMMQGVKSTSFNVEV